MSDRIKIPVGKFALTIATPYVVYLPDNLDLEKMKYTGNLYGEYDFGSNCYYISSTHDEEGVDSKLYIGRILAEKPTMFFYEREINKLNKIYNHLTQLKKDVRWLESTVNSLKGIDIPVSLFDIDSEISDSMGSSNSYCCDYRRCLAV